MKQNYVLLTSAFLSALLNSPSVLAVPELVLSNYAGDPGNTICVDIGYFGDRTIGNMSFVINYDPNLMTPVTTNSMLVTKSNCKTINLKSANVNVKGKLEITIAIADVSANPLATIPFTIAVNASAGEQPLTISNVTTYDTATKTTAPIVPIDLISGRINIHPLSNTNVLKLPENEEIFALSRPEAEFQTSSVKKLHPQSFVKLSPDGSNILDSLNWEAPFEHGSQSMLASIITGSSSVQVFYGTDRNLISEPNKQKYSFGNKRGEGLVFGSCKVKIQTNHKMGDIGDVKVLVINPLNKESFFSNLRTQIENSEGKQAFVFVHGYNTNFEDAARRTAQMAYDLGFQGAPIFFSWPSQGRIQSYTVDESNEEWAVPHLKEFLIAVSSQTHAKKIYLLGHSLGTKLLSAVLREIANESPTKLFQEIILAAPDIDADIFKRDIVPKIQLTANRVTLYVSSHDKALQASAYLSGYPRAGQSGYHNLVIASGLDTIDASSINTSCYSCGHLYALESPAVIEDISKIFKGFPTVNRNLIKKMSIGGKEYWEFGPDANTKIWPCLCDYLPAGT